VIEIKGIARRSNNQEVAMRDRGRTQFEKRWSKRGGEMLDQLYQVRKKRNQFSLATIGEELAFSKEARTSSVKNMIDGAISLTPEYIQVLARTLCRYPDVTSNRWVPAEELEASLAVNAGLQLPSFLTDLSEPGLERVLDLIAQVSLFGLGMAPLDSSPYLSAASPWGLALREVRQAIDGWLKIAQFEAILVTMGIEDTSSFENAESRWRQLDDLMDRTQMPLQAAYAHTLWARVLTRAGASSLAEQEARRAEGILDQLASFAHSPQEIEELLPLKYQTYIILGDNARAKTQFSLALQYYKQAREAIVDIPKGKDKPYLQDRLLIKAFNTHLMARVSPPENLVEQVRALCISDHEPAMKSRAYNSLAWLDRNRRGEESVKAVGNGEQGLYWALKSGDDHRQAVAHQYFGETFLHLGDLPLAQSHLEIALEKHRQLYYGRRGFTYMLLGRVHAYKACRADLLHLREREDELSRAMDCFEAANDVFLFRVGRATNSSYQRNQLLIEQAKWEVFAAWVQLQTFSVLQGRDAGVEFSETLASAQEKLDDAERTNGDHFAVAVNQVILDYVRWCALERQDKARCGQLDDLIDQVLEELARPVPLPKGMDPQTTGTFEHELDGHRARLHAMSGALRWEMGLGGNRSGDIALGKSVLYASQYDFLSLLDSLWLSRLVVESGPLNFLFFNKLRPLTKARLDLFIRTGSSGWSGVAPD
jgi:hypothetical protein